MAFLLGPLMGLAPKVVEGVVGGIQANKDDQSFRNGWTPSQLSVVANQNPGKNIMIIFTKHSQNLQGMVQSQLVCTCPSGHTYTYTCFVFDSGDFTNEGDGGYLNWAFQGTFKRDGSKVTFTKP